MHGTTGTHKYAHEAGLEPVVPFLPKSGRLSIAYFKREIFRDYSLNRICVFIVPKIPGGHLSDTFLKKLGMSHDDACDLSFVIEVFEDRKEAQEFLNQFKHCGEKEEIYAELRVNGSMIDAN